MEKVELSEMERLTSPLLSMIREVLENNRYKGSFRFEYFPEDEEISTFSTYYQLH